MQDIAEYSESDSNAATNKAANAKEPNAASDSLIPKFTNVN